MKVKIKDFQISAMFISGSIRRSKYGSFPSSRLAKKARSKKNDYLLLVSFARGDGYIDRLT
jgi:hypothetical protein